MQCKDHNLIVHRLTEVEAMVAKHEDQLDKLNVSIAVMRVKLAFMVAIASSIGTIVASLIIKWLT